MEASILIPALSISTFLAVLLFFGWSYLRTRRIQKRKDEI